MRSREVLWVDRKTIVLASIASHLFAHGGMGIKSEKTFEEVVERIVAVFRPQKSSDARDFDDCDLDRDSNANRTPPGNSDANANLNGDRDGEGGSDAPTRSAASQDNPTARRRKPSPQAEEITY